MKNFKIAAVGMVAALGLATTALAQQSSGSMPGMTAEQHRQMMSGNSKKGDTGMMTDAQMSQMMAHCEKMMSMMGDKASPAHKAVPPHTKH